MAVGLVSAVLLSCAAAQPTSKLLPVWDMDEGITTRPGGAYNQFDAAPSKASLHLTTDEHRGPHGRAMKIVYDKNPVGYCGVWFHLFDEDAPVATRHYVNTIEYPYLSFWVKGEVGGEDFVVQMADPEWLRKQDSRPADRVSHYLGGPVSTEWREVVVPFKDFRLRQAVAASLTFSFAAEGQGTVYIDDITFKKEPDTPVPLSEGNATEPGSERKLARAMWVWDTRALLTRVKEREAFFEFCAAQGINELFLQVVYRFERDMTEDVECVMLYPNALAAFLVQASSRGIRVHALDGYPEFVLESHHPRVLALVRAVLDFNGKMPPEARFYGIHLDNEPYQILGFESALQESILLQFLDLNEKIMALIRESGSDLVYGVDIPFWFDEREKEEIANCMLSRNGVRKNAAQHIIDIVDNVGIMDYRNFAGGADGMIRHAQGEVAYANRAGKKVYLGVETFKYEPTRVAFLYPIPDSTWQGILDRSPLALGSQVNGFKVRTYRDGEDRYVGLALPQSYDEKKLGDALATLYRMCGGPAQIASMDIGTRSNKARAWVERDPKHYDFGDFMHHDETGAIVAAGFSTREVMLEKVTFAGKSKSYLEEVLGEVAHHYARDPSFIGFAIHYYKTYKAMPDL